MSQNTESVNETFTQLIDRLSDEAKNILLRIGSNWQTMTGNNGSHVSRDLLMELLKIEHSWTINGLKKASGCGLAGIQWGLVPHFKMYGIIEKDEIFSNRFDHWRLTQAGREVVNFMLSNCTRCNNTRICAHCNGSGTRLDSEPCNHTLWTECKICDEDGNNSDGYSCYACISPGETCHQCNNTRVIKCYYCQEYGRSAEDKGKCIYCKGYD